MKEVELRYTEQAKKALGKLEARYIEQIESIIARRKRVPGEKLIEVTASDVSEASDELVIVPRPSSGPLLRELVFYLYAIIGIGFAVYGYYYDQILTFVRDNPVRASYIFLGGMMLALAWVARWLQRRRYGLPRQQRVP